MDLSTDTTRVTPDLIWLDPMLRKIGSVYIPNQSVSIGKIFVGMKQGRSQEFVLGVYNILRSRAFPASFVVKPTRLKVETFSYTVQQHHCSQYTIHSVLKIKVNNVRKKQENF